MSINFSASLKVSSYFEAAIKDFSACLCSYHKQAGKKKNLVYLSFLFKKTWNTYITLFFFDILE